MSPRNFVRDYLTFTRRDRTGALVLIFLILFVYLLPFLSPRPKQEFLQPADPVIRAAVADVTHKQNTQKAAEEENTTAFLYEPSRGSGFSEGELFFFDPNTLPADDWKRLGLKERTIKTLTNFRSKGGRFYKPEDLKKIWGMPSGFYERVASYIRIADSRKAVFPATSKEEKRERKPELISANTADTSAFIALPGIGSKLAFRIVNFREKLGGFYSVEQIGETYGLPDSTFQKIKPRLSVDVQQVRKININTATKEELKTHPYIKWHVANALVEYRNQHGNYTSVEELKKIVLVDEALFEKIAPYLSL